MPHHCAVTLKADDPEGFVDTGTELPCIDPHIYLSVSWIRNELARLCAMAPHHVVEKLADEVDQLYREIEGKDLELRELNAQLDAISVIESSEKFKARRKPGPKKKAAQAA
jgi:hypothetical protein